MWWCRVLQKKIWGNNRGSSKYLDKSIIVKAEDMDIIDGYVGIGYAQSRPEELEFIQKTAKKKG